MQVWINTDDVKNVGGIAVALEKAVKANADKQLKAFIIFINPKKEAGEAITKQLEDLASDKKIENVALAYLSGPKDPAIEGYRVNTDEKVKNTLFVYKKKTVESKFVNLAADKKGLEALNAAIEDVLK